jgi:negative regulator of flagellin synthesis FlgM
LKIEISNTASALLSGSSTAEFDAEKVARISSAIDDGSFKINPEAIADKLISNAQEVLSKVQSS